MGVRLVSVGLTVLTTGVVMLAADGPVTFHKDVEPILQRNCQTCHRPGQVAPMSFLTYQNVRPWAKAMKAAVLARKMPPWFADPQHGPYLNDRSLKQNEIDTIAKWADAGAPEGDVADAPAAVAWPDGWAIKPDIIVNGPVTDVPASPKNNVVEWITVIMPTGFTKDTWVTSVQIKPEFPAVTHHICVSYIPHNPNYKYGVAYWADKERDEDGSALPEKGPTFLGGGTPRSSDGDPTPIAGRESARAARPTGGAEDCYLPGNFAADYRSIHAAKLIPAGSDISFGLHYTPNGKAVTDSVIRRETERDREFFIVPKVDQGFRSGGARNAQVDGTEVGQDTRAPTTSDLGTQAGIACTDKDRDAAFEMRPQSVINVNDWPGRGQGETSSTGVPSAKVTTFHRMWRNRIPVRKDLGVE